MARFLVELPDHDRQGRLIDLVYLAMVMRGSGSMDLRPGQIKMLELGQPCNVAGIFDECVSAKRPETDDYMAMAKASS